jgi:acetolactate synthase small subunit
MEENNKSLLTFSDDIQIDKNVCEENRILIEMKIWNFLGKHTERYTMGDSTSIPIETAEELLNSICFLLGLQLRGLANVDEVLIEEDISELLKASWSKIVSLMEQGKKLLEAVRKSSPNIENISYNDTLNEIGEFFNKYDYRFFAHKIDCSIDYQLSNPVSEKLQGIEYINEYLKALLIENEFYICFDKNNIIYILNSYCSDYKELLINIFEPIVTNAIGLDILGENISTLAISALQRERLLRIFRNLSKTEMLEKLRSSAKRVCDILGIVDNEKIKYIQKTAVDMYPRIEVGLSTGNIDNIFLSFKYEENPKESEYIDNAAMDDERLRNLINEINDCRFISDKIAVVKEEIHSLSDLVEVLGVCFWEDEALELFKTLSEEELYIIKHYLNSKCEANRSDSEWEIKFMDYIRELSS